MRLSRYERVATWLCAARTHLDLLNVPRGPDGERGVRAHGVRDRVLFRVLRRGTWGQPPAAAPDEVLVLKHGWAHRGGRFRLEPQPTTRQLSQAGGDPAPPPEPPDDNR